MNIDYKEKPHPGDCDGVKESKDNTEIWVMPVRRVMAPILFNFLHAS